MENQRIINCFIKLLVGYMNQGERSSVVSFNSISTGLDILEEITFKDAPDEEMSLIFAGLPEIKALIDEKSDDFLTDAERFRKIQEKFDSFFENEENNFQSQNEKEEKEKNFYIFIKSKKSLLKAEIETRKNLAQIIHDDKESY